MPFVDLVKDLLDGLIDFFRVSGRHRTLQNTDSSDVAVDNGFKIFALPKRIPLEPSLEIFIEDRNEGNGFLDESTAKEEEMLDILRVHQLFACLGILLENLVDDGIRILEF